MAQTTRIADYFRSCEEIGRVGRVGENPRDEVTRKLTRGRQYMEREERTSRRTSEHARRMRLDYDYRPALLIHSRYASACRSTTCCFRSFKNDRRFSTRSRSLANSLRQPATGKKLQHKHRRSDVDRSSSTSRETHRQTSRQIDRQTDRYQCLNCKQRAGIETFRVRPIWAHSMVP